MLRTFLGLTIPLNPAVRQALADLGRMGDSVKVVTPANLHITLRFLGDTDEALIPSIAAATAEVARRFPPCELVLGGIGAFPDRKRPSVIWAGVSDSPMLGEISAELEKRVVALGFAPETREFHPHLTLARVKSRPPAALFSFLESQVNKRFGCATVVQVTLYQSDFRPDQRPPGPQYTTLGEFNLAGASPA